MINHGRRAVVFTWMTSTHDGFEHAVLDRDNPMSRHPAAGPRSGPVALCGDRIAERRASLLEPPGPRCPRCVDRRGALEREQHRRLTQSRALAEALNLLRRMLSQR